MKKILVKDGAVYVYDAPNSESSEAGEWITLENGEHVKTNNGEIVAGAINETLMGDFKDDDWTGN